MRRSRTRCRSPGRSAPSPAAAGRRRRPSPASVDLEVEVVGLPEPVVGLVDRRVAAGVGSPSARTVRPGRVYPAGGVVDHPVRSGAGRCRARSWSMARPQEPAGPARRVWATASLPVGPVLDIAAQRVFGARAGVAVGLGERLQEVGGDAAAWGSGQFAVGHGARPHRQPPSEPLPASAPPPEHPRADPLLPCTEGGSPLRPSRIVAGALAGTGGVVLHPGDGTHTVEVAGRRCDSTCPATGRTPPRQDPTSWSSGPPPAGRRLPLRRSTCNGWLRAPGPPRRLPDGES